MHKILAFIAIGASVVWPVLSLAGLDPLGGIKNKMDEISHAVADSRIYQMIVYGGSIIGIFIGAILIIFLLIMLIKRD